MGLEEVKGPGRTINAGASFERKLLPNFSLVRDGIRRKVGYLEMAPDPRYDQVIGSRRRVTFTWGEFKRVMTAPPIQAGAPTAFPYGQLHKHSIQRGNARESLRSVI